MPIVRKRSELSPEEKAKLKALMTEARSRGIVISQDILPKNKRWPVDSNGYFTKLDGKFYNPSEKQAAFINSDAVFSAFYGSRACGKSSSGAQKAMKKIMNGGSGVIGNPDFENLKISTWPEFREWIPWDMVAPAHKYRSNPEWQPNQPFKMAFLDGVTVIVKGIKDPDSARGPNVNWFWYDEAQRDEDGLSWQTAVASVRVGINPQSWATFTPNGQDHWTTKFFVNEEIPEDALEEFAKLATDRLLIEHFHGTIFDNKDNLEPGYFASMLAAYPAGWLRQQEIYGEIIKREGALGDRAWFNGKMIPVPPTEGIKGRVRYWDLAATEKKITGKKVNDPDETVGTKMSYDGNYFYIEHQHCGFWEWDDIKDQIVQVATLDGPYVKIFVEQEPGSGGKNQVAELASYVREKLPGHPRVEGHLPKDAGDKVMRANTWFAEAKDGLIFYVNGEWVMPFFDQLDCFNMCRHDDKIDSVSGARHTLAPVRKWSKVDFLHL